MTMHEVERRVLRAVLAWHDTLITSDSDKINEAACELREAAAEYAKVVFPVQAGFEVEGSACNVLCYPDGTVVYLEKL
jgi:hypothetical protein